MTEDQYLEIIRLFDEDKIIIGIDRSDARKFFTDLSLSRIQDLIGEKPYIEKATVMTAFIAAPVLLLIAIVQAFFTFGWWGLAALIIYPIIYLGYSADSCRGNVSNKWISLLLVGIGIFYVTQGKLFLSLSLLYVVFSLWLARFIYVAAATFCRMLVIRNYRAWLLFNPYIKEV